MNLTKTLLLGLAITLVADSANAQEYKIKQTNSVSGMSSDNTVYVKGKRKRTETSGIMGVGANQVTIEQCDLQRTIYLNTKKKLYFIEPFADEEVSDEAVKTAVNKPTGPKTTKKGGTITMYYAVNDSGERKQMHGFTARHLWTSQRMIPSADACLMKDSFKMKTEGWYIDLPEFNCPPRYAGTVASGGKYQPDCLDKFITKTSGKGKLGFPLTEKRTIYLNDGKGKISEMVTEINTVELTVTKLDTSLFTIPPGYTLAKSQDELNDEFNMNDYVEQMKKQNNGNNPNKVVDQVISSSEKPAGTIRIGVYAPTGAEGVDASTLQSHLVIALQGQNVQAVSAVDEADARSKDCDYVLTTQFTRMKQASKVGGIIKAIKNTDPNAASSWNVDADLKLSSLSDGSLKAQEQISGKYNGKQDVAAMGALSEGGGKILRSLR